MTNTLSSKRIAPKDSSVTRFTPFYYEDDVKEFIKELIAKFNRMKLLDGSVIEFEIKASAGEKLC